MWKGCGLVSWHAEDVSCYQVASISCKPGDSEVPGGCAVLSPASSNLGLHSAHTILQGLQLSQHFLGQILIDLFHQVAPDITHLLFPEVLWE